MSGLGLTPEDAAERASKRLDREIRKSAAANTENAALRREIRQLRHENFILRYNLDAQPSAGYAVRYEKVAAALAMIREIALVEANGIPPAPTRTMETWRPPSWFRKPTLPGSEASQ